jgi:molybdopterin-synthase adenylyltransferase
MVHDPALNDAEIERYARQIILHDLGGAGQTQLKAARVAVIGAGGIGCPALQYLCAGGVGAITIFDDDTVALSNLARQILFGDADVGQPKALVAAAALRRLNPHCRIDARVVRLNSANAAAELAGHDLILDGTDSFASRLIIADTAHALRIALVSAAIGQFHGQLAVWRGWRDDAPCYRCYVGDAFDADDCDTCAEQGVLGAMAGLMGSFAAVEAIRALTGFGRDQTGMLHILEGLAPALRTIRMPKDPACATCGSGSG